MTSALPIIAAEIRRLAKERSLDLSRVADLAGIGRTTLFQVLRERSDPRFKTLEAIARPLGVHVVDLIAPKAVAPPKPTPAVPRTPLDVAERYLGARGVRVDRAAAARVLWAKVETSDDAVRELVHWLTHEFCFLEAERSREAG